MNDEQWVPVPGCNNPYEASTLGRVQSLDTIILAKDGRSWLHKGRILKQYYSEMNYLVVRLRMDDRQRRVPVHRIICRSFHGEPAAGQEVRHLNGNEIDNRPDNLKWGTRSENIQDIIRHGRHKFGNATECIHGHPFDEENTYLRKVGDKVHRRCRACKRVSNPWPNNTSGFRGVSFHKRTSKWQAYVKHRGIAIFLGYFDNAQLAGQVAQAKRKELGIR